MNVIVVGNNNEVGEKAAMLFIKEIEKKIRNNRNVVLGLSTGRTMIPFYKNLVEEYKKRNIDFENIVCFNIDEYIGLSGKNKNSFRNFMDKNLFEHVNIKKKNIYFPSKLNYKKYDLKIKQMGGIDLQILGIGRNGHIGYNEPGSNINSETRIVKLSEITRKDNAKYFVNKPVPLYAVTMGISSILSARKIILLGSGRLKSDSIFNAIKGEITNNVPASLLRKHKNITLIIDKGAASKLEK